MGDKMRIRIAFVVCVFVLGSPLGVVVQGRPSLATSRNNNCSACHTTQVPGRMEVTGEDSLIDLGTQLDGNVRGPLKTYKVVPGQVVTLSVRVLDSRGVFAVQLKDFEKPGRRTNSSNLLVWSPANDADNIWIRQQVSNPPYFTKDNGANGGISGSVAPITYVFDLLIESGTPFDVYELVFVVPGRIGGLGSVYQEEHFYLEVTAPQFDFNGDRIVDCADMCMLVEHWQTDDPRFDIAPAPSGDGIVDAQDLVVLSEHLFEDYRLAAHWKLDETEGAIAGDSIGGKDGTLIGDPLWQPSDGHADGALEFDGADDYISTDFAWNPVVGPFSVLAWIKGGAPGQVIVSQMDVTSGRTTIFGSTWLGTDPSNGKLVTMLMDPPFGPLESEAVITDGQWHHVGLVYDLDALHRRLYVDGVEVAADTDPVGGVASEGGLYFGAGKTLDAASFFSGLIDDVRIYPLALSAEEVATLAH
ncbi:MAG: LamG-like jellyroll fold domain-containing protein [Planctomycetota bacterium]|jgi:hypothetical protein